MNLLSIKFRIRIWSNYKIDTIKEYYRTDFKNTFLGNTIHNIKTKKNQKLKKDIIEAIIIMRYGPRLQILSKKYKHDDYIQKCYAEAYETITRDIKRHRNIIDYINKVVSRDMFYRVENLKKCKRKVKNIFKIIKQMNHAFRT